MHTSRHCASSVVSPLVPDVHLDNVAVGTDDIPSGGQRVQYSFNTVVNPAGVDRRKDAMDADSRHAIRVLRWPQAVCQQRTMNFMANNVYCTFRVTHWRLMKGIGLLDGETL